MNSYQQTNKNYLANQVMSATPVQLISMLMAGTIKNIKLAQTAIEVNDKVKTHEKIILAQDMILELKYAVKTDIEGSVGPELINMYNFMYNELVQANINNDKAKLVEVEGLMTDLLTTWKQLEV